ncbi:MAG: YdcF family protein, partial [Rhodospirillales bacterium]|nr:YdcF family protein [Rhodospirillales bacterium]
MTNVSRHTSRRRLMIRGTGIALAIILGAWIGGLVWFAGKIPQAQAWAVDRTDAVVVLTGGSQRLSTGLRLLADGKAEKLFVSGVARGVDVAQLLRVAQRNPQEMTCCIVIGYAADNTEGNARETAEWMRSQGFGSLRLVTASYHMPRSLLEFYRVMPSLKIIAYPVFPTRFKHARWWMWPGTASLLASEFTKFIIAKTRTAVKPNVRSEP